LASWFALVKQISQVTGPARTTLFELAGSGFGFLDGAMAGTPTEPLLRAAGRIDSLASPGSCGHARRPRAL
jgi:hypothetical protein